ncbi:TRAP transporter permease [Gemmatimonadota bacterium]
MALLRKYQETHQGLEALSARERRLTGASRQLFRAVAIIWALFQLALPSVLILDSIRVRAIHLAFALFLVFLTVPVRRLRRTSNADGAADRVPSVDWLLAIAGAVAALYLMIDWQGIALRSGVPSGLDVVMGVSIALILLEAARRVVGPALSIIVGLFALYAFLGPWMPEVLAFKGVSLRKFVTQVSLSSEGIYGIPLGVSASVVYLFVLLGALLEKAGAGKIFIDMALTLLGRFRGGPAKAAVASSGLMGMISGSSIANIVTTGTFTIPLMKKTGYPPKKAAAIEVAASTDGQLMPPIMGAAAFIIAEYVNVPYIAVVKAAIIPALVSYAALFYITHLEALKLGITGLPRSDLPPLLPTFKRSLPFLLPVGVLLFELLFLRHSPELSAFRAIIVLLLVIFGREAVAAKREDRPLPEALRSGLRTVTEGFVTGSRNMLAVAVATAAAGIIVGIVGLGIGGMIANVVEVLAAGNVFLLLLITAVASLLLGMGLPTTATYIVMASLTAPIIVEVGAVYGFVVPLMAAHLFCFYFGILADDTPPVGLASYAAAALAESEPIPTGIQGFLYDLRTAVIPFMFIFNTDLILHNVTSWPQGVLIFVMAVLGAFAFTSAVQGYLARPNRWYEVPLLLVTALILFNPSALPSLAGPVPGSAYGFYAVGVALFAGLVLWQRVSRGTVRQ